MTKINIDLAGKVCPYPVVNIIRQVDMMNSGETIQFKVDDPLAIKSVPEELDTYDNIDLNIEKVESAWIIKIKKSE